MRAAPEAIVRLGIRVPAAEAEIVLARLLPLLAGGVEERREGDAVEYAVYGARDRLPADRDLRALAGDSLLGLTVAPVADGWQTAWHEHLRRVEVGRLAVRPPWVAGADDDLVIEPGTAFGAGTHPTTQLCLELLQSLPAGGGLCDWGAGTGVLAIAAARLGWAPVTAVELAGAELVAANAAANGVAVAAVDGDLADGRPFAPTVVANLTLPLLLALARDARRPRRLLASGFLAAELPDVARAWEPLRLAARAERDGWAAAVLEAGE